MKVKQLFEKLIKNWQIKAICFVAALFLYAVYQNQSLTSRVFSVSLGIETKNGFVSVEPHPRTVAVSVKGKAEELAQVRESDLSAYLDLSYVSKDGKYDFPVLLTLSDSASVLNPLEIKVTPESVSLRVEEEITSYVDLEALVYENPASGYFCKNVTVSPSQIAVTGPKTMINSVKSLKTLPVTMSGAKRSFASKTKVENKGMFVKHDNVEVTVTVEIEEMTGAKQFTGLQVKVINLSPELEIKALPKDVAVTLRGSMPLLEKYVPGENFVTADASDISEPGTFYLNLHYEVPHRFSMEDGYTKTLAVTFAEKGNMENSEGAEKITVVETAGGSLDEKVIKESGGQ